MTIDWTMTCTKCGEEIPRGEEYVAFDLHVERVERRRFRTAITVKDAEMLATYHVACARGVHIKVT